ncbi:MAG: acyl-CoA thioesterase, partial [Betaproteobacteria bacterium]|nr:acyl-CoA thioesterase [Betaproteobacteria bacterium]
MEKWFELYRAIVMPAQCDVYGHMNVRHYAACFDDAGWHFPRMADLSLEEIRSRGLGTVVATLTIDFHHEIRAGQLVLIKGAVTRVGTKSFSHEMRLYEAASM